MKFGHVGQKYLGDFKFNTYNSRKDDWAIRINSWIEQGIEEVYFFLHQEDEKKTVHSVDYMIRKLNEVWRTQFGQTCIPR